MITSFFAAITSFLCGPPSVAKEIERDIVKAQRGLLDAQHNRDYYEKQVDFCEKRLRALAELKVRFAPPPPQPAREVRAEAYIRNIPTEVPTPAVKQTTPVRKEIKQ